jgi:hypothetical protein
MGKRFVDDERTVYELGDQFLVQCPRCRRCASVVRFGEERSDFYGLFSGRRLTCDHCAYTQNWPHEGKREVCLHGAFDWYFDLPLWLQTPCRGYVLFAYNAAHLDFLEEFVAADLREVARHCNQSLASRLPRWMQARRSREDVLQGIARLRARLRDA